MRVIIRRFLEVGLALSALLFSQSAFSCGFCAGDKAAAVYSFENIAAAKEAGNHYVAIEVIGANSLEDFNAALESLKKMDGVDLQTVTGAFAQRSVSFVFAKGLS